MFLKKNSIDSRTHTILLNLLKQEVELAKSGTDILLRNKSDAQHVYHSPNLAKKRVELARQVFSLHFQK